MTQNEKIRWIQVLNHFLVLAGLVYVYVNSSWELLIVSLVFGMLLSAIGINIGFHRYITHNHFTVAKPIEWLFVWLGSMIMVGSPISYAVTHTVHHKHSDTNLDPHGPVRGLKSVWMYFQKTVDFLEINTIFALP